MQLIRQRLVLAMTILLAATAQANLEFLDPEVLKTSLVKAQELCDKRDVKGLMTLLKESHLFIKENVALMLGRLGAVEALEDLRRLDKQYAQFACAESGAFGVAVILLENTDPHSQKNALLAVATGTSRNVTNAISVVDAAGRELNRFQGDDIEQALTPVNTYGAQFTVLATQCRKVSLSEGIAKCVAVLESHETPQKAGAAESLLVAFGKPAIRSVQELKTRVEKQIQKTDPAFTLPKTILSRCKRILDQIGDKESANQGSERTGSPLRGAPSAHPDVRPDPKTNEDGLGSAGRSGAGAISFSGSGAAPDQRQIWTGGRDPRR